MDRSNHGEQPDSRKRFQSSRKKDFAAESSYDDKAAQSEASLTYRNTIINSLIGASGFKKRSLEISNRIDILEKAIAEVEEKGVSSHIEEGKYGSQTHLDGLKHKKQKLEQELKDAIPSIYGQTEEAGQREIGTSAQERESTSSEQSESDSDDNRG